LQLGQAIGGISGPFMEETPLHIPNPGMVMIPAGTFEMGCHVGSCNPEELPVHPVSLDAFYMDVYEVTNAEYAAYLNTAYQQGRVMVSGASGNDVVHQVGGTGEPLCDINAGRLTWNGSVFGVTAGKEDHPMLAVSWYGACAYANQRSREDGLTPCYDEATWSCDFGANGYRLPTEAEWEYAARGGQHNPYTMFPWGDTIDGSHANYFGSGDPYEEWWQLLIATTPVGYYDGGQIPQGVDMANGYGLYDMAGNVAEWCWDWYDSTYYSWSPTSNPTGPPTGAAWHTPRVNRGRNFGADPGELTSTLRGRSLPAGTGIGVGFRLVAACR
jgi:formylglycine-generating enzyme required for sulfatase activity